MLTPIVRIRVARTPAALRIRCFSAIPRPEHSIYVSDCTDPYFNLAFEDWLFRQKAPDAPLLLLYRDDPCVVIGRHQNPWKEVNMRASHRTGIPFIRRQSGGGTVFHDLGNTNFSIHLPRGSFDRRATGQVVLKAVRSLGIDATLNDRNDICVGGEKICSAYKIVRDRAYHHGTMLISTELDTLGGLLHSGKNNMKTRGVESVRSPVCNLQQHLTSIDHEKFVQAVVGAFQEVYGVKEEVFTVRSSDEMKDIEAIQRGMADLKTWDWAFGQSPEFTNDIEGAFPWGIMGARIRSKNGVILSCSIVCPEVEDTDTILWQRLLSLVWALGGQRYGFVPDRITTLVAKDARVAKVWEWLREEMDI